MAQKTWDIKRDKDTGEIIKTKSTTDIDVETITEDSASADLARLRNTLSQLQALAGRQIPDAVAYDIFRFLGRSDIQDKQALSTELAAEIADLEAQIAGLDAALK